MSNILLKSSHVPVNACSFQKRIVSKSSPKLWFCGIISRVRTLEIVAEIPNDKLVSCQSRSTSLLQQLSWFCTCKGVLMELFSFCKIRKRMHKIGCTGEIEWFDKWLENEKTVKNIIYLCVTARRMRYIISGGLKLQWFNVKWALDSYRSLGVGNQ